MVELVRQQRSTACEHDRRIIVIGQHAVFGVQFDDGLERLRPVHVPVSETLHQCLPHFDPIEPVTLLKPPIVITLGEHS